MKTVLTLLSAVALCISLDAGAHSELPSEEWCAQGRPVPVASFEIFAETLVADRERDQTCTGSAAPGKVSVKTCGQFDDDYDRSRTKALAMCGAHSGGGTSDFGSVIAVVQFPGSYLHQDHHRLYRAEHGLRGICVRCERPQRPLPAPTPR
jgi:hypothetical protein